MHECIDNIARDYIASNVEYLSFLSGQVSKHFLISQILILMKI